MGLERLGPRGLVLELYALLEESASWAEVGGGLLVAQQSISQGEDNGNRGGGLGAPGARAL